MSTINKYPKVKSFFAKAGLVALLSSTAYGIALGSAVAIEAIGNPRPDSITSISNDFASSYGVTSFTKTNEETIPGIQSTTATFEIKETSTTSVSKALLFISKNFAYFTDENVVNVVVNGVSADGKKTYNFAFYGSSPDDLKDGSLENVIIASNRIYIDEGIRSVNINSQPTVGGGRSSDFSAGIVNENSDSLIMQSEWTKTTNAVRESLPLENSLYSVSLTNDNGASKLITFESSFFDDATFAQTQAIDPKIWKAAETFVKNKDFNFLDVNNVTYTNTFNTANSVMKISLNGDGSGVDSSALIAKFTEKSTINANAHFPNSHITLLKFVGASNAFYTGYPQ
jgi:hypothetical protein